MNLLLTELLNLPGVMVEDYRQTGKELFLEIEVYAAEATCPRCGNISRNPQHTNNGLVEGINNKLKLIKRSGFGFTKWRNFETQCLLSWHFHTYKA